MTLNGLESEPIPLTVTPNSDSKTASDFIEIENSLDKTELYSQESAVLATKVIVKTNPRRIENAKITPPSVEGMTITPIDGTAKQHKTEYKGAEATVTEQHYLVTADKAGSFQINGIGYRGVAVDGNFRQGNTRFIDATVPSDTLTVVVKPIPEQYKGTWIPTHSLSLNQTFFDQNREVLNVKNNNLQVADAITREIYLDIEGTDSTRFPSLDLAVPSELRVNQYSPTFSQLDDGKTRMTIKQELMPQSAGDVTIVLPNIEWWNSLEDKAEVVPEVETHFTVTSFESEMHVNSKQDLLEQLNSQVSNRSQASERKSHSFTSLSLIVTILACVMIGSGFVIVKRRSSTQPSAPKHSKQSESDIKKTETLVDIFEVIKGGDVHLIRFHVIKWLIRHPCVSQQSREAILEELNEMSRLECSTVRRIWNPANLNHLLKAALREKAPANKQSLPIL